jgi:hypothetical protein
MLEALEFKNVGGVNLDALPFDPPIRMRITNVGPEGNIASVELIEGSWPPVNTIARVIEEESQSNLSEPEVSNVVFSLDGFYFSSDKPIGLLEKFPVGIDNFVMTFMFKVSEATEFTYQWYRGGQPITDSFSNVLSPQFTGLDMRFIAGRGEFSQAGKYELRVHINEQLVLNKSVNVVWTPLVGPIMICERWTDDATPCNNPNELQVLPTGTKAIHIATVFANLQEGWTVYLELRSDQGIGGKQEIAKITKNDRFKRHGHIWSQPDGTAYPPGRYQINFLIDDQVVVSEDFEIR